MQKITIFFNVNDHFSTQGRALKTASSLDEGLSLVVSLNPFSNVDYQNNDNLVHLSAKLRTLQVRLIQGPVILALLLLSH